MTREEKFENILWSVQNKNVILHKDGYAYIRLADIKEALEGVTKEILSE